MLVEIGPGLNLPNASEAHPVCSSVKDVPRIQKNIKFLLTGSTSPQKTLKAPKIVET